MPNSLWCGRRSKGFAGALGSCGEVFVLLEISDSHVSVGANWADCGSSPGGCMGNVCQPERCGGVINLAAGRTDGRWLGLDLCVCGSRRRAMCMRERRDINITGCGLSIGVPTFIFVPTPDGRTRSYFGDMRYSCVPKGESWVRGCAAGSNLWMFELMPAERRTIERLVFV